MTRTYTSYRQSGVGWLGDVPAHWAVSHLRRTFDIVNGGTPPVSDEEFWDGEIAWLTPDDLGRNDRKFIGQGQRNITSEGIRSCSARLSPANSVLLSTRAPIGHLAITEVPAASNQGCRTLVPLGPTQSDFAYYALLASRDVLQAAGKGSTFMELSAFDLGAHRLPTPPIDEQHSISAFLDREVARIDKLISMQESLIERLDEYRMALITQAVTTGLPREAAKAAGLDPEPKLRDSGVEWLGEVPAHWEIARLKWSTTGCIGGVWGDEPDGLDDLLCVRVADFDRQAARISLQNPTLRSVSASHREGRMLSGGDLLLEKSGGGIKQLVGCVVLYDHDVPAVCSNFVGRVVLAENAHPAYWAYVHRALYAGKLNYPAIKQTTGIQNLDTDAYFDTPVAFPPYLEQIAIAEYVGTAVDRIDALRAKARMSIERLLEYRSAVITAAVTGKIDVRDAAPVGSEVGS